MHTLIHDNYDAFMNERHIPVQGVHSITDKALVANFGDGEVVLPKSQVAAWTDGIQDYVAAPEWLLRANK